MKSVRLTWCPLVTPALSSSFSWSIGALKSSKWEIQIPRKFLSLINQVPILQTGRFLKGYAHKYEQKICVLKFMKAAYKPQVHFLLELMIVWKVQWRQLQALTWIERINARLTERIFGNYTHADIRFITALQRKVMVNWHNGRVITRFNAFYRVISPRAYIMPRIKTRRVLYVVLFITGQGSQQDPSFCMQRVSYALRISNVPYSNPLTRFRDLVRWGTERREITYQNIYLISSFCSRLLDVFTKEGFITKRKYITTYHTNRAGRGCASDYTIEAAEFQQIEGCTFVTLRNSFKKLIGSI